MFKRIKDFFGGPKTLDSTLLLDKAGGLTQQDLHIATAVLLVEMAGADRDIANTEAEMICSLMEKQFSLLHSELPDLIQIAVGSRKDKGKVDEFIACVNSKFTPKQRRKVVAMVWKVMNADGQVHQDEIKLFTELRTRLELTSADCDAAKKMVESGEI